MPRAALIMDALGALCLLLGLAALFDPDEVRTWGRLESTPQMAYIMRIVGTMLSALGLILFVFSTTYWLTARA